MSSAPLNCEELDDWGVVTFDDHDGPVHAIYLTEQTLARTLWLALRRKTVLLLGTRTVLPVMRPLVNWLHRRLASLTHVRTPADLMDQYNLLGLFDSWQNFTPDLFSRIEPWHDDYYGFGRLAGLPTPYGLAYRHAVCINTNKNLRIVVALHNLVTRFKARNLIVEGADPAVPEIYRRYFGEVPPGLRIKVLPPSRMLNFLAALVAGAGAIAWLLAHVRFRAARPEPVEMGSDIAEFDHNHLVILGEICREREPAMLVTRNATEFERIRAWNAAKPFRVVTRDSGVVAAAELPGLIGRTVARLAMIWRRWSGRESALFAECAKFPLMHNRFHALARRYRFASFCAKDDYNTDHVFRTHELRRHGTFNFGISHGITVPNTVSAQVRQIDFDAYYCFCKATPSFYRDTWPAAMRVRAGGACRIEPRHYARRDAARDGNICVMFSQVIENDRALEFIDALAAAFPERKVVVKHKRSHPPGMHGYANGRMTYLRGFERPWRSAPNVVQVDDDSYELILRSSLVVSTWNSTIAIEAIQLGTPTYILKLSPTAPSDFWHIVPEILADDPGRLVADAHRVLADPRSYPWDACGAYIDLDERPIWETVREDIAAFHAPAPAQGNRAPAHAAGRVSEPAGGKISEARP